MPAGAPEGNNNAGKAKIFYSGLKRALARNGQTVEGGLNKICDKLVTAAVNGEQWAILAVRDTTDGKPAQSLDVGNKEGETFRITGYEMVPLTSDPQDTNTE